MLKSKDGWILLNVWAIFTFALFSFSQAKLPAYILPIFPALAVMLAWRFFGNDAAGKIRAGVRRGGFAWAVRCCCRRFSRWPWFTPSTTHCPDG